MINPNKSYKAQNIFKIAEINTRTWEVTVKDHANNIFTGWLDKLTTNPNRFHVGDFVNIRCRFSIMLDQFVIESMRKNNIANMIDSISENDIITFKKLNKTEKALLKFSAEDHKVSIEKMLDEWNNPTPHFNSTAGHRFQGLASEYINTSKQISVCVYCLKPK